MNFTIYCKATGRVLRGGYCPPEAVEAQAQDGEGVLFGVFERDGIVEGGEWHPLPPCPSPDYEFDYTSKVWVYRQDKALQNVLNARRAAYPPITDYLDAIVKGDEQQLAAYIEKCRAIKEKYPHPIDGYLDAFDDGDDDDVYI